jgi:hypothetical protein
MLALFLKSPCFVAIGVAGVEFYLFLTELLEFGEFNSVSPS